MKKDRQKDQKKMIEWYAEEEEKKNGPNLKNMIRNKHFRAPALSTTILHTAPQRSETASFKMIHMILTM